MMPLPCPVNLNAAVLKSPPGTQAVPGPAAGDPRQCPAGQRDLREGAAKFCSRGFAASRSWTDAAVITTVSSSPVVPGGDVPLGPVNFLPGVIAAAGAGDHLRAFHRPPRGRSRLPRSTQQDGHRGRPATPGPAITARRPPTPPRSCPRDAGGRGCCGTSRPGSTGTPPCRGQALAGHGHQPQGRPARKAPGIALDSTPMRLPGASYVTSATRRYLPDDPAQTGPGPPTSSQAGSKLVL